MYKYHHNRRPHLSQYIYIFIKVNPLVPEKYKNYDNVKCRYILSSSVAI